MAGPSPIVPVVGTGNTLYSAIAAQPTNTWLQATSFQNVKTFYDQSVTNGYIPHGGTDVQITTPWSGAALRPDGMLYITGGGHLDGGWNGLGAISLETGVASLPVMPTIMTDAQFNSVVASWRTNTGDWQSFDFLGIYPSHDPYSVSGITQGPHFGQTHTYGMFFVSGNEVLVNQNHLYNVAAGTGVVTPGAGLSDTDGCQSPDGKFYLLGGLDPYAMTQVDWVTLPRKTDGTPPTVIVEDMNYPYIGGQGANIVFGRHVYSCVIGSKLYVVCTTFDGNATWTPPLSWNIDLPLQSPPRSSNTNITTSSITTPWTAADMAQLQLNTQAFDDINNVMYIPSQDWSFFLTYKPLTGECGKITMLNICPATQTNSAYGRFGFYHNRQCFYLVNDSTQAPFFFRAGPSVPTQAITLSTITPSPILVGTAVSFTVGTIGGFSGTITPTVTGGTGTFSPTTLTGAGTFTFTPSATATDAVIGLTNTGAASNPPGLHFVVTSGSLPPPLVQKFRLLVNAASAGSTGVKAQIFTRDSGGLVVAPLLTIGYSDATLTMPGASGGVVTLDLVAPTGVTTGQTVKGYLENSTHCTPLFDATVVLA